MFEFDGKGGFTLVSSPVAVMDAEGGEANAVDFSALTDEEICGSTERNPATYRGHLRPKERRRHGNA